MSERFPFPVYVVMLRSSACMGLLCVVYTVCCYAQDPLSNRALLDSCVAQTVAKSATHWPPGRMEARVDSSRDASLIMAPMYRATGSRTGEFTKSVCTGRLAEAQTRYKSLGHEQIERTVVVRLAVDVRSPSGSIIWAGEDSSQLVDTLRCDDMEFVERGAGFAAAHAPNPCVADATVWSSVVEPALLLVASATVIVLLFTIRGH